MSTPLSVKLVGPKSDAVRLLRVHLERGKSLRQSSNGNRTQLDEFRGKKDDWMRDTADLLKRIFDAPTVADGFADANGRFANYPADTQAAEEMYFEELDLRLARLGVVLKRVESSPDVSPAASSPASIVTPPAALTESPRGLKTVLVVSHHVDNRATEAVSEFLGRLGLTATLQVREHGQPLEVEGARAAAFAIMLMQSDDANQARPGSSNSVRSDVAFDMGFLSGAVGSNRIAVLFPQPGDGFTCHRQIPYIPLDLPGGWMLHIARHMKRAGVEVDLNRVL